MRAADWRLIAALNNRLSHQLAIALEAFHGLGEVGDEVIAQSNRVLQGISVHAFEIDPVMRALSEQPGLKSNPHSCPLRGSKGGSQGVASWLESYSILEPDHVGTVVH